ncbi:MAG TPA: hypothetical protein VKP65_06070 [Rhodothermales bacterium]|nr:hypothetical protein [Rhodothermales bacterium]
MNRSAPPTPGPPRVVYWMAALIMLGAVGYYAFQGIDRFGLSVQYGEATVIDKEYRPAGQTYTTQVINGRTQQVPQATPEMFILTLDVDGEAAQAPVERDLYNTLQAGDQVSVSFIRRRITGNPEVTEVNR